jgi:hypothetical protein
MTQFHEGQEVDVACHTGVMDRHWRKAKIVRRAMQYIGCSKKEDITSYQVEFSDRSRDVFEVGHIKAVEPKVDWDMESKRVLG